LPSIPDSKKINYCRFFVFNFDLIHLLFLPERDGREGFFNDDIYECEQIIDLFDFCGRIDICRWIFRLTFRLYIRQELAAMLQHIFFNDYAIFVYKVIWGNKNNFQLFFCICWSSQFSTPAPSRIGKDKNYNINYFNNLEHSVNQIICSWAFFFTFLFTFKSMKNITEKQSWADEKKNH
jgi:hypothetical protein